MIHAEEKFLFGEIHQQRNKIFSPPLNFHVIALADVINADVNFRSARHLAGNLFAHEEVRVAPQLFRRVDRIVIRQSDDGHTQFLAVGIDLVRQVVGFLGDAIKPRRGTHSRSD